MEPRIETKVDEFLMMIREKKKVPIEDIKFRLNVSDELLEKWILMFEEKGLIKRIYPANPLDVPYIVLTERHVEEEEYGEE